MEQLKECLEFCWYFTFAYFLKRETPETSMEKKASMEVFTEDLLTRYSFFFSDFLFSFPGFRDRIKKNPEVCFRKIRKQKRPGSPARKEFFMAVKEFPRTQVENVSLSRMIIGTNWLLGWSHTSVSADEMIKRRYDSAEAFKPVLEAYLNHGVDSIMAPFGLSPELTKAVKETEQKVGREIIMVDTPSINVSDSSEARREAEAVIRESAKRGSKLCLIHHSSAEQLVNKNLGKIVRLDDYTKMIRDAGMVPGLSAHMPELIVYSDQNGYDVQTYIQIFNCMGFLMQVEIETVASIIQNAKKPVMTIKSMAAGRCSPYVGLTFSWNAIREKDMVTVGAFSAQEAEEDIEISLAAIEHRFPNLEKRSSPNKEQAAFGK